LLTCSMLLVSSLKLNYLENICMGAPCGRIRVRGYP